jgi:hypothetical protein
MRWSSFLYQGIDADKTDLDRKGPDETPGP